MNYPNLVSKNIDSYFNNLLNQQYVIKNKNEFNFSKFYSEYIEHNILLIFIITIIIIIFIVKYYNKHEKFDNNNYTCIKKKIRKKKVNNTNLEEEKQSILDIIDELSSLNYSRIEKNNERLNNNIMLDNTLNNINYNNIDNNNDMSDYYDVNNYNKYNKYNGLHITSPFIE